MSTLEWDIGGLEYMTVWSEAKAVADRRSEDGWRLPTVAELATLFDYEKFNVADPSIFRGWYWAAHGIEKEGRMNNWRFSFGTGIADQILGDSVMCRVRLVREEANP